MDTGSFMRATCEFTVPNASNPAVMVWDFYVSSATGTFDLTGSGLDITDALIARHYTPMSSVISNGVTMTKISLRSYTDAADGYDRFGELWTGTNPNVMLPPFNTFSIQLVRNNYLMRNGRKAYPGPTVDSVATGGVVASSIRTGIGDITDVWATTSMTVESDVDIAFANVIVREPATPLTNPTVWSYIFGYGVVKFGTQNTRK